MKYGVYAKENVEVVVTSLFHIVFERSDDISTCKLYKEGKLISIIQKNLKDKSQALYAFLNNKNEVAGNKDLIGRFKNEFPYSMYEDDNDLFSKDKIDIISNDTKMPTVSDEGIEKCLKKWRLGSRYNVGEESLFLQVITNNIEYIIAIDKEQNNIYCGASLNIPYENGLFGGGQYFRIRNYADNSEAWCWNNCKLGDKIPNIDFKKLTCTNGECIQTAEGIYWTLKRYSDDEIVLQGCGNDEYVYNRNYVFNERFFPKNI